MAENDPRRIIQISTNNPKEINRALGQICEMVYQQEGRRGQISLRDKLVVSSKDNPLVRVLLDNPNSVWTEISSSSETGTNRSFLARGAALDSGGWIAKAATASIVAETETGFTFYYNSGLTVGAVFIPNAISILPTPTTKITRSTNQSIPDSAVTAISFDAVSWNVGDMANVVSQPTRITIQTAGKYVFGANILWADNATGRRQTIIAKNGSVATRVTTLEQAIVVTATIQAAVGMDSSAVGDFYEVYVFQSSGAPLNVLVAGNAPSPHFWAAYQGG
jgi:hypothetical protein